jgi:hypothetical protein
MQFNWVNQVYNVSSLSQRKNMNTCTSAHIQEDGRRSRKKARKNRLRPKTLELALITRESFLLMPLEIMFLNFSGETTHSLLH